MQDNYKYNYVAQVCKTGAGTLNTHVTSNLNLKCGVQYVLGTVQHYIEVVQQTALSSLICTVSLHWHTATYESKLPQQIIIFPPCFGVGEVLKEMFLQVLLIRSDFVFTHSVINLNPLF